MTRKIIGLLTLSIMLLASCGGDKSKKDTPVKAADQKKEVQQEVKETTTSETVTADLKASQKVIRLNPDVIYTTYIKRTQKTAERVVEIIKEYT
jgi:hypothetical protein